MDLYRLDDPELFQRLAQRPSTLAEWIAEHRETAGRIGHDALILLATQVVVARWSIRRPPDN